MHYKYFYTNTINNRILLMPGKWNSNFAFRNMNNSLLTNRFENSLLSQVRIKGSINLEINIFKIMSQNILTYLFV